jgi:hypothetical protein
LNKQPSATQNKHLIFQHFKQKDMPVKASNVKAADPGLSFILHNLDERGNNIPFNCDSLTIEVVIDDAYTSSITINPNVRNAANRIIDSDLHLIMPFGDTNYNNSLSVRYEIKVYWPNNPTPDIDCGTAAAEKGHFKPAEPVGAFKVMTNGDNIYLLRRAGLNQPNHLSELNGVDRNNVNSLTQPGAPPVSFNNLRPFYLNHVTIQPNSFSNDEEFLLMPNGDILVINKTENNGSDKAGIRVMSRASDYTNFSLINLQSPLTKALCEGAHFFLCNQDLLVVIPSNNGSTYFYLFSASSSYNDMRVFYNN